MHCNGIVGDNCNKLVDIHNNSSVKTVYLFEDQ